MQDEVAENEATAINDCNNLVAAILLEEIPRVQAFKGKWATIRAKLADLQTHLTDLADLSSNPLSLDLILSLSQSLRDAVSVARKCQAPSLTEGKLKTQSDVGSVLAKLDGHVRDADILIKSGVLQDSGVVSGSNSSNCSSNKREAIRAESRNLITRLQIGSTESKNAAMDSLLGLLQEDDKNVMIAVAQGVVPVLVRLIDSSSAEIKERAVAAISRVSTLESSKHVLIAEGLLLLNHLLRVLESGSGFAKEKACAVLKDLSFSKENARAIGSRGGISSLLEICQGGTPGSQALAAGVLRNLVVFEGVRENLVEENGVFVLLGLAASGTLPALENAFGCLCNLATADGESLKLLIVREGGIECLRNFWDSCPPVRSLEAAIELLRQLAKSQPISEVLVSDGFIPRLVPGLSCGVLSVRIAASRAVYELGSSTKTRKEMGECGCIVPLIIMMDGKAAEEKEAAVKALSLLLLYAGNRRIFRKDERGIVSTVQLLDPSLQNLDKRYPVSLLASLVHSKKWREQMIAAGASLHLKKLVEMNVEGAKKLLEGLGRSKIWGIFARP